MSSTNLNPIFFEKTREGERIYDVSSRLMKDRIIFLDGVLDDETSNNIVGLLYLLDGDKSAKNKEIQIWINSPGGILSGFFAIYDMMNWVKSPIHTIGMGEVASAASMLLSAGTPGHRSLMPNCRVMIHDVQLSTSGNSSHKDFRITVKEIGKLHDRVADLLARHTQTKISKVKKDIEDDKYMSAEEAIEYGLADNIFKYRKKIPDLPK